MRYLAILTALAIVQLGLPASAQTPLFQKTTTEMTLRQVLAAQPNTVEVYDEGAALKPDEPCLAKIVDYRIGGASYRVCFLFQKDSLTGVTVSLNGQPMSAHHSDLLSTLRVGYGKELSMTNDELGTTTRWLTKVGTDITLLYVNNSLSTFLKVVYRKAEPNAL